MADALGDIWWLEDENKGKNTIDDTVIEKSKNTAKKRKSSPKSEQHVTAIEESHEIEKKKKKKRKKKKPKIDDVPQELQGSTVTETLWNSFYKSCSSRLTPLELDDLRIDESCCLIEDTVHTGETSQLPTYLEKVIPYWHKQVEKLNKKKLKGSPLLLLVSSAATRAVDVNKSLEEFKGDTKVVKLFAKHFKLEDQVKFLASHPVHMGIGTPNRILKLLQNESLPTTKLKYVILDWTWRDQKLRSIADMPEVKEDLNQLLQHFIFPLAKSGKVKIGLF